MSLHVYLEIMRSLGVKEPDRPSGLGRVVEGLPSWFDVSGLAEASISAAAVQVAAISDLGPQNINVDCRLCGLWFGWSLRAQGWVVPNPWDPVQLRRSRLYGSGWSAPAGWPRPNSRPISGLTDPNLRSGPFSGWAAPQTTLCRQAHARQPGPICGQRLEIVSSTDEIIRLHVEPTHAVLHKVSRIALGMRHHRQAMRQRFQVGNAMTFRI